MEEAHSLVTPAKSFNFSTALGFWSALLVTLGGILYFLVMVYAILSGAFTFPLPEWLQTFGGIASLVFCPLFVILMSCLHQRTPLEKRTWSQISLGFTLLFAIAVSINRFTQLGAVRLSLASGPRPGIDWFLPYGDHSAMLGLEMMGWGWFLGLAMLFAAPLFSGSRLGRTIRWMMLLYAGMGIFSAVCYLLGSPLSVVGFAAWGVVLNFITGFMAVDFRNRSMPELRE